jgi:SAM-dependent methyltransferase
MVIQKHQTGLLWYRPDILQRMEYADEPRLIFSPLSEHDYCTFYSLEMTGYVKDVPFYTALLERSDHVLELGCGTGRLTRKLAKSCQHITGIDRSVDMLQIAKMKPLKNVTYALMDMLDFSFSSAFDLIIIPYNTINLLGSRAKVEKCLKLCHTSLKQTGKLAFQTYHPDTVTKETNESEKQFQFTILDDLEGGKIVKETLKWFDSTSTILNLEERYRVRHAAGYDEFRDLKHTLQLYTPDTVTWKTLLHESGFSIAKTVGEATGKPFCDDTDTCLFIHAERLSL